MALRINHNISSINTQRQLADVNRATAKTLEHLSSGLKINHGADGPAALVISENMRAQISGLHQAIENSENGVSMVQTAEASLSEVNRLLNNIRQLAVHASNEGVNDEKMLEADQQEIENALATIDRIAQYTQFGTKKLIDGSRGANGVANGENLQFVSASETTGSSPVEGYKIEISQAATKSNLAGSVALTQDIIDAGEKLSITEGGKTVSMITKKGESVEGTINEFDRRIREAGLNIEMIRGAVEQSTPDAQAEGVEGESVTTEDAQSMNTDGVILRFQHKEFGSEHTFSATSTTAGVLSEVGNVSDLSNAGLDVEGRINGEEGAGRGQVLTGKRGNLTTENLAIRYSGDEVTPAGEFAGTVSVSQNSLRYQIGANAEQTTAVSLRNMSSTSLGKGVENESGFENLADIDVRSFDGAQDALRILDQAIQETSSTRARLGAFQKNNLEGNLNHLRQAMENMTASESVIRDADMAKEMADFTKNQIMTQSATAMLAQANSQPQSVLSLLG